jgi:hypothetical protein
MPHKVIRYRIKPEKIEENQRLIEGVFRELHAKSPANVRYLVLKLADGSFCLWSTTARRLLQASTPLQHSGTVRRGGVSMSRSSSKPRSSAITVCLPTPDLNRMMRQHPQP